MIPAPVVVDGPGGLVSRRTLSSRVADLDDVTEGVWHIALAEAYLPEEGGLREMLAAIGHPEIDAWDTTRVSVIPTWSYDHAVAALQGLLDRLDELGGGLLLEVNPYHQATGEDRRRYVAWLVEHGFTVVYGTKRKPLVMHRPPMGGGR